MSTLTQKYKDCIGYKENISSATNTEWSIITLFGLTPVHPDEFAKLDPRLKWFGKCLEGDCFCGTCGTISPNLLSSHHKDCCNYVSKEDLSQQAKEDKKLKGSVENRQQPLQVIINDGKLQITIGLEKLSACCEVENESLNIVDSLQFGKELVGCLSNPEYSKLYNVFDEVAEELSESGSLSMEFVEDQPRTST